MLCFLYFCLKFMSYNGEKEKILCRLEGNESGHL